MNRQIEFRGKCQKSSKWYYGDINQNRELGKIYMSGLAEGSPEWIALEFTSDREPLEQKCRVCGCSDDDCTQCIELTGEPCHWVEPDLCSACLKNWTKS